MPYVSLAVLVAGVYASKGLRTAESGGLHVLERKFVKQTGTG